MPRDRSPPLSRARELPCPHCLAPLRLGRADFYPSRKRQFRCEACQGLALLPLSAVGIGVGAMLLFMFLAIGFARPLFERNSMETAMDFVWATLAFLAIVFAANYLAAWVCATQVTRLDPWPRPSRK